MRIMILIIRSSGLLQLISPGHGCGRRFLRQIVNLWNVAFSAVSGAATPGDLHQPWRKSPRRRWQRLFLADRRWVLTTENVASSSSSPAGSKCSSCRCTGFCGVSPNPSFVLLRRRRLMPPCQPLLPPPPLLRSDRATLVAPPLLAAATGITGVKQRREDRRSNPPSGSISPPCSDCCNRWAGRAVALQLGALGGDP